ncbi:MAG: thioredoxin family protein [Acidobacteriota bacterium]
MAKKTSIALGVLSLLLLGLTLGVFWSLRANQIEWQTDYEEALDLARAREQHLITYLYTDWCTYCKQMDRETFSQESVIEAVGDRYVWVKLNAETNEQGVLLNKKFAVTSYPTLLIMDSAGEEIDRIDGFVPPDKFAETIEYYIQNPESFGRLRQRAEEDSQSADSQSAELQFRLAAEYLQRQNFTDAEATLSRIIEFDPENNQGFTDAGYYYRAFCLLSQDRPDHALADLQILETRFSQSKLMGDAALLKGEIYYSSGDRSEARKVLAAFVAKYPGHHYIDEANKLLAELGSKPPLAASH